MHITDIPKEGMSSLIKTCRTVLMFHTDVAPLRIEVADGGVVFSTHGGGALARAYTEGVVKTDGVAMLDLAHVLALHLTSPAHNGIRSFKKQVEIRSGKSGYKLQPLAIDEEKAIEIPKPQKNSVPLQTSLLREAVKTIWFGHDDSGTGDIRILFGKKMLRVETADEMRGVVYRRSMPDWNTPKVCKAVLPKKAAEAIINCFTADESVWMDVTHKAFRLYTDTNLVSIPLVTASALIDVYPVLRDTVQRLKKVASVVIQSDDLKTTTRSAIAVVDEKNLADAEAVITISGKSMKMESAGDIGSFDTRLSVEDHKGKDVKFNVLSKNLKDLVALASGTGEKLRFEVWGKELVMLRNVEDENYKTFYSFPQLREMSEDE